MEMAAPERGLVDQPSRWLLLTLVRLAMLREKVRPAVRAWRAVTRPLLAAGVPSMRRAPSAMLMTLLSSVTVRVPGPGSQVRGVARGAASVVVNSSRRM